MEPETEGKMAMSIAVVSKSMAVVACVILTFLYVAILYAPTFILRLPPPTSYKLFLIRRFFCAAVSSLLSLLVSSALLPIQRLNILDVLAVYGVRAGHVWHTLAFPFLLTLLMYMGSLVKSLLPFCQWNEGGSEGTAGSYIHATFCKIYNLMVSYASDITAWRNLVVAPITEELVFRGCMIPLLLCGGFNSKTVVFICPIFFSLDILLQVPTIADFYKVLASSSLEPCTGVLHSEELQSTENLRGRRYPASIYNGLWLICIFPFCQNWPSSCSISCTYRLQFHGTASIILLWTKRDIGKSGIHRWMCGFCEAAFPTDTAKFVQY